MYYYHYYYYHICTHVYIYIYIHNCMCIYIYIMCIYIHRERERDMYVSGEPCALERRKSAEVDPGEAWSHLGELAGCDKQYTHVRFCKSISLSLSLYLYLYLYIYIYVYTYNTHVIIYEKLAGQLRGTAMRSSLSKGNGLWVWVRGFIFRRDFS